MMLEIKKNSDIELVRFLKEVEQLVSDWVSYSWLDVAEKSILEAIKSLFAKHLENILEGDLERLNHFTKMVISHLRSLLHNIKLFKGQSLHLPEKEINVLWRLIIKGGKILEMPKENMTNPLLIQPFKKDQQLLKQTELEQCSKLKKEQKYLYNPYIKNPALIQLLQSVWRYSIEQQRPTKKIFISYAWPIANVHHEKWTKNFIKGLAKNLCLAGCEVYLDETHSGPGVWLKQFMGKIPEMDHILIINTETMDIKLQLPASGVRYEAEQIKSCLPSKKANNFIINILIKNDIYAEVTFRSYPAISFFTLGYLDGLKSLIAMLYDFTDQDFNLYWQKQVETYHVSSRLWNLQAISPFYLPRLELQMQLAKALLPPNTRMICYGEKGAGKTELFKYLIHTCYGQFKAVYWFNANTRSRLMKQYVRLAKEENIKASQEDSETVSLAVKEWLAQQDKNCLLIYDSVTAWEIFVDLLPDNKRLVIITAHEIAKNETYTHFAVPNFSEQEALDYVGSILQHTQLSRSQLTDLNEPLLLVAKVGRNPLQLALACGYIQRNRKTISEFVKLYFELGEKILANKLFPIKKNNRILMSLEKENNTIDSMRLEQIHQNDQYAEDVASLIEKFKIKIEYVFNEKDKLISEDLKSVMELLFQQPCFRISENFKYFISHVEAILVYCKSISYFKGLIYDAQQLIAKLPSTEKMPGIQITLQKSNVPSIVVQTQDYPEEEKKRCEEQMQYTRSNAIQLFLHDVWKYALGIYSDRAYRSKKLYIFLVDDGQNKTETWVSVYIEILRNHLLYAGFCVYPETLMPTQHDIPEQIDHVLVISHRNANDHFDKIILQHPKYKIDSSRFVIPILLNNVNHLASKEFREIAELSFYKSCYLDGLHSLITTLYGFDHQAFTQYWRQQLIYHQIVQNTWNTPVKTKYFVGRSALLSKIWSTLNKQMSDQPLALTAFSGLGGVGKTQLALQFIRLYGHFYSRIYWINAATERTVISDYTRLGENEKLFRLDENLSEKEKIQRVKNWLENMAPQGWLIIYDNADKYTSKTLRSLIPTKGGKVLVTSRHTEWENSISVNVFSKKEALEYIAVVLGNNVLEIEHENAINLAKILQRLPLALAHACAYIQHNDLTIAQYLSLDKMSVLAKKLDLKNEEYDPVTLTWHITVEKMLDESILSVELLYCCSYFYHQNIPTYLLEWLFYRKEESQIVMENKYSNAARIASEYSMINVNDENTALSLHGLVHEIIGNQINVSPFRYLKKCIYALINGFRGDRKEEIKKCQDLKIHLAFALSQYDKNNISDNDITFTLVENLLTYLANSYINCGEYHNALTLQKRLLQLRIELYGNNSEQMLASLNSLGTTYKNTGNLNQGIQLLQQAKTLHKNDTMEKASLLINLGNSYLDEKKYIDAEIELKNALDICLLLGGEKNEHTLNAQNSLAIIYGEQGNYQKKKELLGKILPLQFEIFGKDHPIPVITLMNLANTYGKLGDQWKREILLKEVLEIKKLWYGEDHPQYLQVLYNLALTYGELGDLAKKEQLLKEIIVKLEKYYGHNTHFIIDSLSALGTTYTQLEKLDQAQNMLERALEIGKSHKGTITIRLSTPILNLAIVYNKTSQKIKARQLLQDMFQLCKAEKQAEMPDTINLLMILSKTYLNDVEPQYNWSTYTRRLLLLQRALRISNICFGEKHVKAIPVLLQIAMTYDRPGEQEINARRKLLDQVLEICKKEGAKENHSAAQALRWLATVYFNYPLKEKQFLNFSLQLYRQLFQQKGDVDGIRDSIFKIEERLKYLALHNEQFRVVLDTELLKIGYSRRLAHRNPVQIEWGNFRTKYHAKTIFSFFPSEILKKVGCLSHSCFELQQEIETERLLGPFSTDIKKKPN